MACFDCEMPSDGEEILITLDGRVKMDVCYKDGEFWLHSGYDWVYDVVAWMPSPKPYKGSEE